MKINPLSNPKGVKHNCELCGKPAFIQCADCRVTYYCDKEHQHIDFNGIHNKICHLLVPLRTPVTVLGSEEERAQREKETRARQIQLFELTKTEAHKKLFESQYNLAIPAALQALKFSMDVYGQNSIELVPSYLLLGEASIGLKQYEQAEDYLSLAKWAVMKAPHCQNEFKSQLHRNFGLLYSALGNYKDSLEQLANDIYYSCLIRGPDHITVTGGFFLLGNVFHKNDCIQQAESCYDKVMSIWKLFLNNAISGVDDDLPLDEAQQAEAVQMFSTIQAFRSNYSKSSIQCADIDFIQSQLYYICGEHEKCKEYITKVLEVYEPMLGREHSQTLSVKNFLKQVQESSRKPVSKRKSSAGAALANTPNPSNMMVPVMDPPPPLSAAKS